MELPLKSIPASRLHFGFGSSMPKKLELWPRDPKPLNPKPLDRPNPKPLSPKPQTPQPPSLFLGAGSSSQGRTRGPIDVRICAEEASYQKKIKTLSSRASWSPKTPNPQKKLQSLCGNCELQVQVDFWCLMSDDVLNEYLEHNDHIVSQGKTLNPKP